MNKQEIMNLPEDYKITELGPLPEDWEVVKLREVIRPDRTKIRRDNYDGKVPIVQKIPFDTGEIIFRDKRETRTDLYVANKKNHLIISKINFHQGAVAITYQITAATTHYEFYNVLEKVDIFYLWRYFRTEAFKQIFAHEIKFRGFKKEANFKFIKEFKIPLPPLPEQKKIAVVLSAVQEAKEKTEEVIKAAKELKKSLMKYLFTYGPVPLEEAEKVKLKETEIGEMPKECEVVLLKEIANVKYGKANPKDKGNVPVVGSGGIYSSTSKALIDKPTIVIGRKGTAGKPWLMLEPSYPSDTTFYLDWKKEIDVKFIFNYMFLNPLSGEHAKTTLPSLQKPELEKLQIPLPPLLTQQKIASVLSVVDNKIQAEESKKKALEDLFKTLLHDLMTAKIRVNHLEVEL